MSCILCLILNQSIDQMPYVCKYFHDDPAVSSHRIAFLALLFSGVPVFSTSLVFSHFMMNFDL